MASTRRLPGSTSMASAVTPRAWARAISARISAAPTPRRCQASATTTPTSVTRLPFGQVGGHGVPDDDAVGDGDDGIDVGRAAGQQVEQPMGRPDRGEEPAIAALHGQCGEEITERGLFGRVDRAYRGGGAVGIISPGSAAPGGNLGSVHEPSMTPNC